MIGRNASGARPPARLHADPPELAADGPGAGGRYRALVPDLPGHGQAAHRTASFDACAAYVRGARPGAARSRSPATRWAGGSRCTPRSRSGQRSSTRLVLVGASPGLADPAERAARRAADDALADRIETLDDRGVRARMGRAAAVRRPAARASPRARTPTGCATRPRAWPRALRGLGTGVMEPLWDRLPELTIPVTLIVGERDEKFRALAEAMLARLPNARLVIVARRRARGAARGPGGGRREAISPVGSPSSSASA